MPIQKRLGGHTFPALHLNVDRFDRRGPTAGDEQALLVWNHLPGLTARCIRGDARFPDVKHPPAKETVSSRPGQKPTPTIEDFRGWPVPINQAVFLLKDWRIGCFGGVLFDRHRITPEGIY